MTRASAGYGPYTSLLLSPSRLRSVPQAPHLSRTTAACRPHTASGCSSRAPHPHTRYEQRLATLVVRSDGTHVRMLIAPGTPASACSNPSGLVAVGAGGDAKLIDPRTGAVVRRDASCAVARSPDGRLRAYTSSGTLYVSNADASGAHPIATSSDGSFFTVSWSPDSTRLAYAVIASPSAYALELVDPDGTNRVRVKLSVSGFRVSWSPDGRRLAFSAQAGGRAYHPPHLYLVAANGTGLQLFAGGDASSPDWSPRRGWIACTTASCISAAATSIRSCLHIRTAPASACCPVASRDTPGSRTERGWSSLRAAPAPARASTPWAPTGNRARRLTNRCGRR